MPPLSASAGLLLRASIGAGLLCAAIVLVARQQAHLWIPTGASASIAIEHRARTTPDVSVGNLRSTARVAIANRDQETIAVSVPETWVRSEVTGVPLKDVVAEAPAFGFIRWTLPEGGTIAFEAGSRIDHLELYNPSGIPMHVVLRRTDILTGEAEEQTMLIQESPSTLF